MKNIKLSDTSLALIAITVFIIIGAVFGWLVRTISTRDQLLMATISKYNSQREYYDAQIQQVLVDEQKLKEKKHGKSSEN